MPNEIQVKSVLNKAKGYDSWFLDDYTINPYSGCSFNCLFCYIRGSKYGTNMAEKLSVKQNALEVLERQLQLRAKKEQFGFVVLASATEPYLQFEKDYRLTRGILELLLKYRFPVHIITRSDLVVRDFDLLEEIDRVAIRPARFRDRLDRGALISFSFSTHRDEVARIFEPGATPPSLRLTTLQQAVNAGFHAGVSNMPLLPYITDAGDAWEEMVACFAAAGARYMLPASLTLFGRGSSDSRTLVLRAVSKHYPHLLDTYHRFFDQEETLPAFYHAAFQKKARELGQKYGIPLRIIAG